MKDFFYELFHLYDYETYETFSFTQNTLRMVFLFAWAGIILALIGSFYSNHYLGGFVKKLIDAGADSPENAKTLHELDIKLKWPLSHSLREGSVLRKSVKAVKTSGDDPEKKQAEMSYYIPEDAQITAQKRFRTTGNGVGSLVICIVGSTVALLLLLIYGPWLFGLVDSLIASAKGA
jgi:hypothetical protein